jgi:hypothetical protein
MNGHLRSAQMAKGAPMTILSELVGTVARVTGMSTQAVALLARHAREAGLIVMSGRGPSAASMGPADAANLLIAVSTTKHAIEVPKAIPLYRQLVAYERDQTGKRHSIEGVAEFGDALEQLILAAGTGRFPNPFLGKAISRELEQDFTQGKVEIAIRFSVTFVAAALRIVRRVSDDGLPDFPTLESARIELAFDFFPPKRSRARVSHIRIELRSGGSYQLIRDVPIVANLIEEAVVGHRAFREIGQLIAPIVGEPRDTNR